MSAAIATLPRVPATVLVELRAVRDRQSALYADTIGRDLTEDEDRRWSGLDDSRDLLEAELRGMVRDCTGVSWDALAEVLS